MPAGHADAAGVPIPPPAIYVAGFLIGLGLDAVFPTSGPSPTVALVVGVAGVAAWLALDGYAMVLFQRARTSVVPMRPTTALVISGPYRVSRNPMYVGMAFLYAGLAIALGVLWALGVLPFVLFTVDRLVIRREERYLEAKFGDDYRNYKRRVRRWL